MAYSLSEFEKNQSKVKKVASLNEFEKTLPKSIQSIASKYNMVQGNEPVPLPIVDNSSKKHKTTLPKRTQILKEINQIDNPSRENAKNFLETLGVRTVKDLTQIADALMFKVRQSNIDRLETDNILNQTFAQKTGDTTLLDLQNQKLDTLKNIPISSNLTQKLQQKEAESLQKLKENQGVVGGVVTDTLLSGADLATKSVLAAATGLPLPLMFATSSYADTLQEDINKGINADTAQKHAMGSGIITGSIESLTGAGASKLSKLVSSKAAQKLLSVVPKGIAEYLSKASSSIIGNIIKDAIGEGLEEALEYDVQRIYQNLILGEDTPRDIKEQAYSALIGGLVGGLFGGAKSLSNFQTNVQQEQSTSQNLVPNTNENIQGNVIIQSINESALKPVLEPNNANVDLEQQNQVITDNNFKDLGADLYNPEAYSNKLNQYGAIPEGETPSRIVDIPQSVDGETKVRQFTRTAMESDILDDTDISNMEQKILKGDFNYTPTSNAKTLSKANHTIETLGYDNALKSFQGKVYGNERIKAEDIALGERLIQMSKEKGDFQTTYDLIVDVAQLGTELGQATQALRILKRLSPEGQLQVLTRQVNKINAVNNTEANKKTLQEISRLEQEITTLNNEIEVSKNNYDNLVELRDTQLALQNTEIEISNSETEVKQLDLLVKSLDNSLTQTARNENQISDLSDKLINAQQRFDIAQQKLDTLKNQRETLRKQLNEIKSKTKSINRKEYKTWWEVATLNQEVEQAKKQMEQAQLKLNLIQQKSDRVAELKKLMQQNQIIINQDLVAELLASQDEATTEQVLEKIKQDIADQMPSSWVDKWNAWRYLSMLGNPRTHIRNIVGNAIFHPVRTFKNIIGAGLEQTLIKNKMDRTKAILTPQDSYLKDFARQDFEENKKAIKGEGKYSLGSEIQEKRTIFKNKALEKFRNFNFDMLEKEDALFLKNAYITSFAQAMKAKGVTPDTASEQTLNEIRNYATKEAQKATYRDASELASAINTFKNKNKGTKLIGEGLIPFTKTPINIINRGVEYSPIGLVNGLKSAAVDLRKGNITASEAIDKVASGLTGTGIMALGAWLASLGLITGGRDEDKKQQAFDDMQGIQNYALKIGDYTYTIDWGAPTVLPLFIGVELYNAFEQDGATAKDVIESVMKITEPVFELSMLQGINNAIKTAGYSQQPIVDITANTAGSYAGQAVPTALGQIARIIDDTTRTTYNDKNSPLPNVVQSTLQKAQAKIPFANQLLQPRLDNWGREEKKESATNYIVSALENFVSPGYISKVNTTKVDTELQILYDNTGENVLPPNVNKYWTYNKETVNLSAEEYYKYKKERGEISYKYIEQALNNNNFKSLSDDLKVDVIKKVYEYANAKAKYNTSTKYDLNDTARKVYNAEKKGINPVDYFIISDKVNDIKADKDKKGNSIQLSASKKKYKAINNYFSNYSKSTLEYLYDMFDVSKEVRK